MTDHCIANSLLFFFRTCKERKSIEVLQSLWIIANVPIQLCVYRHRSPNQQLQTKSFWGMMIFLGRSILRLFFFRRLDNFISLASIRSNFVTVNFWWDTMSRHFVRRCEDSKKEVFILRDLLWLKIDVLIINRFQSISACYFYVNK
jgi:hypothetical protein